MSETTTITDSSGNVFVVDASIEQIGAMSKAKLSAALVPIAEQHKLDRIEALQSEILILENSTSDESLLAWARAESPEIEHLNTLEQELLSLTDEV